MGLQIQKQERFIENLARQVKELEERIKKLEEAQETEPDEEKEE